MSLLLLCAWSSVIFFTFLLLSKYRWTPPPLRVMLLYAMAGLLSTVPAGIINNFLMTQTQFSAMSGDRFNSMMGFFLGAGLGEEFFKMSAGLIVTLAVLATTRHQSPATRLLGFTAVGLAFAVLENFYYSDIGFKGMILRNILAVPLHGTMGMIHGVSANRALVRGNPLYLVLGYAMAVMLHTVYDLLASQLPPPWDNPAIGIMIVALFGWAVFQWRRTPELGQVRELERSELLRLDDAKTEWR